MTDDKLQQLRIASERKQRSQGGLWMIIVGVLLVTVVIAYFAVPRASDSQRGGMKSSHGEIGKGTTFYGTSASTNGSGAVSVSPASKGVQGAILTTSGYIVNRERIELSPRFMGVVKWIGVKKGDAVTNGQVVVLLDDAEYRARLAEVDGQIAVAGTLYDLQRETGCSGRASHSRNARASRTAAATAAFPPRRDRA